MNYEEKLRNGRYYINCVEDEVIRSEHDALDLIGACGEIGACGVLLHAANLNEEFYRLKSGLAGAVLQKFGQYRVRLAAVIPSRFIEGRFGEMVWEANRGGQFRVFEEQQQALDWLLAD